MRARLTSCLVLAALAASCAHLESPAPAASLSPSAGAGTPPAAAIFYYFCESAHRYYPYVEHCPEGWKTLPNPPPGPVR